MSLLFLNRKGEEVGKWEELAPVKMLVHFRRPDGYNGEFGFDWLQDEFKTCTTLDNLEREYKPTNIYGRKYLIPWLSLSKGKTAKINLIIEELEGDISDKDTIHLTSQKGIRFNPAEIKVNTISGKVKHHPTGEDKGVEVEVICDEYISSDVIINIYNQKDEVIGKLSVLKNDNEKELIFPVRVVEFVQKGQEQADISGMELKMINSIDFIGCLGIDECLDKLESHMNKYAFIQALAQCRFERKNNIIQTYTVAIDNQEWISKGYIDAGGKICANDELLSLLLGEYKLQVEKSTGFFRGVVVFITNFEHNSSGGKGSVSIIDDRHCIIFKSNLGDINSYIHEIGHVLGLAHTFEDWDKNIIQQNEKFVVEVDNYLKNPSVSQADKEKVWKEHKDVYKAVNRNSYLFYRNKYTIPGKGTTKCCYMDYNVPEKLFTQWQWRAIQEDIKKFYNIKNK